MAPHQTYATSQVATSSQGELVVLLYRGAARFAAKARLQLQSGDLDGAHNSLMRAQQIVLELMLGLRSGEDTQGADLFALHSYVHEVLRDANVRKDAALVDEALTHLRALLETWEQVALPAAPQPGAGKRAQVNSFC